MLHAQKEDEKFVNSAVMEGFISVCAVIGGRESGVNSREILRVLYDSTKEKSKARELAFLKKKSAEHGFIIVPVDPEKINELTIGSSHGGIVAECSEREFSDIAAEEIKPNGFYVMLEGIEDPYNFGYALRSIYAAGADGVLLSERNWMSAAGVVARASAGASEQMNIFVGSPEEAIKKFKAAGYLICASDKTTSGVSIYDADMRFPVLLAVGGERRGLSSVVLSAADKTVFLDYGRNFKASLSAASAASVMAFEIFRQNRSKK